jgi:hypothetical protein
MIYFSAKFYVTFSNSVSVISVKLKDITFTWFAEFCFKS